MGKGCCCYETMCQLTLHFRDDMLFIEFRGTEGRVQMKRLKQQSMKILCWYVKHKASMETQKSPEDDFYVAMMVFLLARDAHS